MNNLKKRIRNITLTAAFLLFGLTGCANASGRDKAPDYGNTANWAYFGIGGEEKEADLFLLCPTVDTKDEFNMSMGDTKTKKNFLGALNMERGIYEENTRIYAPYYRQAAMKVLFGVNGGQAGMEAMLYRVYDELFADSGSVSAWARQGVYWAVYHEILRGTADDTLSPGGTVTRAQMAAMMVRYTNRFPQA